MFLLVKFIYPPSFLIYSYIAQAVLDLMFVYDDLKPLIILYSLPKYKTSGIHCCVWSVMKSLDWRNVSALKSN